MAGAFNILYRGGGICIDSYRLSRIIKDSSGILWGFESIAEHCGGLRRITMDSWRFLSIATGLVGILNDSHRLPRITGDSRLLFRGRWSKKKRRRRENSSIILQAFPRTRIHRKSLVNESPRRGGNCSGVTSGIRSSFTS